MLYLVIKMINIKKCVIIYLSTELWAKKEYTSVINEKGKNRDDFER